MTRLAKEAQAKRKAAEKKTPVGAQAAGVTKVANLGINRVGSNRFDLPVEIQGIVYVFNTPEKPAGAAVASADAARQAAGTAPPAAPSEPATPAAAEPAALPPAPGKSPDQ